jgi:hypothetical protein
MKTFGGDRSTVFRTLGRIVVPFDGKPADSFSAKQER